MVGSFGLFEECTGRACTLRAEQAVLAPGSIWVASRPCLACYTSQCGVPQGRGRAKDTFLCAAALLLRRPSSDPDTDHSASCFLPGEGPVVFGLGVIEVSSVTSLTLLWRGAEGAEQDVISFIHSAANCFSKLGQAT